MTTREKMVKFRESKGLDIRDMAYRCRIGPRLMEILEEGGVTTPRLVPQIAEQYGLTELEAEDLMPEHMRPHGPDYDPDRYVVQDYPKESSEINDVMFTKAWKTKRNKRLYDDRMNEMGWEDISKKYEVGVQTARAIFAKVTQIEKESC